MTVDSEYGLNTIAFVPSRVPNATLAVLNESLKSSFVVFESQVSAEVDRALITWSGEGPSVLTVLMV